MNENIFLSRAFELGQFGSSFTEVLRTFHLFMFPERIPDVFLEFGQSLVLNGTFRLPFEKVLLEFYAKYVLSETETIEDRCVLLCRQAPVSHFQIHLYAKLENSFPLAIAVSYYSRFGGEWEGQNDPIIFYVGRPCDKVHMSFSSKHIKDHVYHLIPLCLAAVGLLGYGSLVLKDVIIPTKLQRKRRNLPIYDFRIVQIGLPDSIRKPSIGTHASPALHWRRGHYRRLETGIVPVSPCLVGDARNGIIEKAYDVTDLAGELS